MLEWQNRIYTIINQFNNLRGEDKFIFAESQPRAPIPPKYRRTYLAGLIKGRLEVGNANWHLQRRSFTTQFNLDVNKNGGKNQGGQQGEREGEGRGEGGQGRVGIAVIISSLYYIIGDVLIIKIRFNYLVIISNLQYMKEWQHFNTQDKKNRGFPPTVKDSLQELKQCEESLISSLEMALHINKELILNSLYFGYLPASCAQSSLPCVDTRETIRHNEDLNLDGSFENKKQFSNKKSRIKKKRENYDTKNIPKNFGTAIHIFIKRNSAKVKNLLARKKISYSHFYQFNKQAKQKINSLLHLRELWESKEEDGERNLKECYRIISFEFMRKHCLGYIFGSRIKNTSSHIRYRKKLLEGIERPHTLFNLKDY